MRSNLPTEKKLNTLVKKSVDLKPLQILGWKGIKSKNTAILTLKYPSWEQKVRRPRVKKSGDKKSGKTSNLQGKLVFVQKWGRRTFSMEIGWFWGEIRVLWWRQLINTAVGHYLWGIDTCIFCIWWLSHVLSFIIKVGHYLWGIDTVANIILSAILPTSRTLPMRNWYVNENPSGSWVAPSDITYEELILFLAPSLIPPIFGRTLPMRNWYAAVRSSKATSSQSRTLPMRNWYMSAAENSQDVKYSSICRTLPMRNWYQTYELHFCSPWGSDITYEELILLFWMYMSLGTTLVGHYLWGIDTPLV